MPGAPASTSARVGGWLSDQPYLLLSLTSLFWAGNTVLGRFVVGHIPPMTLAFGRWAGAFLILLPFAAGHLRRDWLVIRCGAMALLALVGFSAYNTMAYYGLQYTTAINGLLLQSIGPLFVALWTFALFGDRLPAASRRHLRLANRRHRHHLPRQSRDPAGHRLQSRRRLCSWSRWCSMDSIRRCCASGQKSIRCRSSPPEWLAARRFSFPR